jgi:hypothetical protein
MDEGKKPILRGKMIADPNPTNSLEVSNPPILFQAIANRIRPSLRGGAITAPLLI